MHCRNTNSQYQSQLKHIAHLFVQCFKFEIFAGIATNLWCHPASSYGKQQRNMADTVLHLWLSTYIRMYICGYTYFMCSRYSIANRQAPYTLRYTYSAVITCRGIQIHTYETQAPMKSHSWQFMLCTTHTICMYVLSTEYIVMKSQLNVTSHGLGDM